MKVQKWETGHKLKLANIEQNPEETNNCVSHDTPNEILVERRQDISVVRLPDVIKERRGSVSRVRNNDVRLVN